MKSFLCVAFVLVAIQLASATKCVEQAECTEPYQCCAGVPPFGGICRNFTAEGAKCHVVDKTVPIFGDFYIAVCPCDEGLECVQSGKKKNDGICQVPVPPTTEAPVVDEEVNDDSSAAGDASASDDTSAAGDASDAGDASASDDAGDASASDDAADSGDASAADDTSAAGDASASDDAGDASASDDAGDASDSGDASASDDAGDASASDDAADEPAADAVADAE